MVKKIKFNLLVDGKSIGDFEQLQDNFSADLLDSIENKKLSKWFSVRDMDDKAQEIANIDPNFNPMEQMKSLCRVLELEDDDDVIKYLLEEKEARQKEQTIRQREDFSTKLSAEEPANSDETEKFEDNPKGEDWSGRDLSGRDFTGADLRGFNLSGANCANANFSRANLSKCNLKNANLEQAKLFDTNLAYSDLREANLRFVNNGNPTSFLSECSSTSSKLIVLEMNPTIFLGAMLDAADLTDGEFSYADFTNVHAHGVKANNADFIESDMDNADFSFSEFTGRKISAEQRKKGIFIGVRFY